VTHSRASDVRFNEAGGDERPESGALPRSFGRTSLLELKANVCSLPTLTCELA
jgi:hypothetical protein